MDIKDKQQNDHYKDLVNRLVTHIGFVVLSVIYVESVCVILVHLALSHSTTHVSI